MAPRQERPPRRRTTSLRTTALAATVALALSAATCSDDEDDDSDGTSSTTQPAGSASTTLSIEDEVEAAYQAYWDMAVRLAHAPNPDDPEIEERSSGVARGNLVDGLTSLQSANQRTDAGERYAHAVLSVEVDGTAGSAGLEDCAVDESRLVDATTGEVIDEGTTTTLWNVRLIRDDDQWLVDEFQQLDIWPGEVDCQ